MDPFVGKLGLFRVHQGTIRGGAQLFVGDGRKPVKIAHLFRMQGKEHTEIPLAVPATSAPWPSSTNCTSTRCCTIRTTRIIST